MADVFFLFHIHVIQISIQIGYSQVNITYYLVFHTTLLFRFSPPYIDIKIHVYSKILDHLFLNSCEFPPLFIIEVYLKVDRYDLRVAFVYLAFGIEPLSRDL